MSITTNLEKTIDWKQGLIIAMGVPILILPSLYDISGTVWALGIAVWTISVLQGFLQNTAIGELSVALEVPGIGGCTQTVLEKSKGKRPRLRKFLGAFAAWTYWFTWAPVVPIFTIMIGDYLSISFDAVADLNPTVLNLAIGAVVYSLIIYMGSKGLGSGARLGLILALITLIPLVVVISVPFFTGDFRTENITDSLLPPDWDWSTGDLLMLFGTFGIAQWSACAWESVATYGPEYKEPSKNLPKALVGCGLICLALYFLVSLSVYGTLGMTGIEDAGYATMMPIAEKDFGVIGSWIALVLLVAGMVMIIQTAYLGSARTLYFMGCDDNMPRFFRKTNANGAPVHAMLFEAAFGLALVCLGNPESILAASSVGYSFALGTVMFCYWRYKTSPQWENVRDRCGFKLPRWYGRVALVLSIYEYFVILPSLLYWSYQTFGLTSVALAAVILLAYIPLWLVGQNVCGIEDRGEDVIVHYHLQKLRNMQSLLLYRH